MFQLENVEKLDLKPPNLLLTHHDFPPEKVGLRLELVNVDSSAGGRPTNQLSLQTTTSP